MSCWLILTSNPIEELAGKSFMCTQSYAYGFTGFLAEHCLLPEPVTEFMTLRLKISCLGSALVLLDLVVNSSGSCILLSVELSTKAFGFVVFLGGDGWWERLAFHICMGLLRAYSISLVVLKFVTATPVVPAIVAWFCLWSTSIIVLVLPFLFWENIKMSSIFWKRWETLKLPLKGKRNGSWEW